MENTSPKPAFFPDINRRKFLKQSGYLSVGFSLFPLVQCSPPENNGDQAEGSPNGKSDNSRIDSWIRLDEDGYVTVLTGKMELGQGIQTALMQIAAEELDVDMRRVRIIMADTHQTPDERYTAGSASIESSGKAIRNAAAEARKQLLDMAEEKLGIPAAELIVADGTVKAAKGNKSVTYWQLLKGRRLEGQVTGTASLKDPSTYKLIGKPQPRADIQAMAIGLEVYVQDMRLPDMVHGRILRPPSYEARLRSLPEEKIAKLPGVLKLVKDGSFVGVIASQEYQAIRAVELLRQDAIWEAGPVLPNQAALFDDMPQQGNEGQVVEESPEIEKYLNEASFGLEATYTRPYHMHASIGPSCAIALWHDEQLTVWTHSQGVYPLRKTLADMLGIAEDNIRAIGVPGSGCYGHNGADDAAADAALLARAMPDRPVRVQWMREDEHCWEPYGSAMLLKLRGGIDAQGNVIAWETNLWSDTHSTRPGGEAGSLLPARYLEKAHQLSAGGWSGGSHRNALPSYKIPAVKVTSHPFEGPLRTSALRSLGAYANVFALESFMDELAVQAQQDPVDFRLRHLSDERAKAVVRAAAKLINWTSKPAANNHGLGIAFAQYKNSAAYFAVAAEVAYDEERKELKVLRLAGAIDAGQTINIDGLKNQTEGGMIQSASWTLLEQVTYDRDRITSRNWDSYPIMRFSAVPEVEIVVLDHPELPPLGAGEAAQGPTAAAIANAVFQATGKRMRDLPITAEKIMV